MWRKWIPWRFIIRRMALAQGFIDPFSVVAKLQRFSQPSEVMVPVEILRLASILQIRGLLNAQAIQHNLDWIWPYWVEKQFDPHSSSFVPRAFSMTHINLTHRNWTAVGLPDSDEYPIIDPRGLVTPLYDRWSIDGWIYNLNGDHLIPSRLDQTEQQLLCRGNLAVITETRLSHSFIRAKTELFREEEIPICRVQYEAQSNDVAWLVISLRPFNPEGVSFIHDVEWIHETPGWKVDKHQYLYFNQYPEEHLFSTYKEGDVFRKLPLGEGSDRVSCPVGMATAAVLYKLEPHQSREVVLNIPLIKNHRSKHKQSFQVPASAEELWEKSMKGRSELQVPDKQFQFLFDAAVSTMILHTAKEVYPGPYTYKHFWFRDAAIILHAMLCVGLVERVEPILNTLPDRQTVTGYFHSQNGEWDSNGQVLWLLKRYVELTGKPVSEKWKKAVRKAAKWIQRKRLSEDLRKPHAGLLPAGFSAEHLGPNDYYYWDDFWSIEGLKSTAFFCRLWKEEEMASELEREAERFLLCVERSLAQTPARGGKKSMPASPYRRMDTGAIGSLAAGFPLQLWAPRDQRLTDTAEYLLTECFAAGGFFHDMSHSGINPYLTLHVAQVLLRSDDPRFFKLMKDLARLATSTGQWPEAVHPITKGGCMGDGQHVWAAAEWVLMLRHCFVREEKDSLVLFSGIPHEWLIQKEELYLKGAPTKFGSMDLRIQPSAGQIVFEWKGSWFKEEPEIELRIAGKVYKTEKGQGKMEMNYENTNDVEHLHAHRRRA